MVKPVGRDPFAPPLNPPKAPPIIRHTVNTPAEPVVNPFVRAKTPTAVSGASVNRPEPSPTSFIVLTELDVSAALLTDYSDDLGNTGFWSGTNYTFAISTGTNEWAFLFVQTVLSSNPDTDTPGPANVNIFAAYVSVDPTTHVVKQTGLKVFDPDLTGFFSGVSETTAIGVQLTYDDTLWITIADENFSGVSSDCICAIGFNDAVTSLEGVWYPSPATYGTPTEYPKWLSSFPVSRNSLILFANGSLISNYDITSGTTYASAYTSAVGDDATAILVGLNGIVISQYTPALGNYRSVVYAQDGEAPTIYTQTGTLPPNLSLTAPIIGGGGSGFSGNAFYIVGYDVSEGLITVSSYVYASDFFPDVTGFNVSGAIGQGAYYSPSTKAYFIAYSNDGYAVQEIGYSDVSPTVGPATSYAATGYAFIQFSTPPTLSQWESGDLPPLNVPTSPSVTNSYQPFQYGVVDGEGNVLWINDNGLWAGAVTRSGGVARSVGLTSTTAVSRVKQPSKRVRTPDAPPPIGVNRSSDPFLYTVT